MKELYNLRHASARNVVERIFGVFKKRFQIFKSAPAWSISTQTKLIHALAVVHNIIRIYDPMDKPQPDDTDENDAPQNDFVGELARNVSNADKTRAEKLRNDIAAAMWEDYH